MNIDVQRSKKILNIDKFGAFASTLCALHCVACAFIPATFAILGMELFLEHETEWILTAIALIFAVFALVIGWRSHGTFHILLFLGIGIVGLLIARGLETHAHHHDHGVGAHDVSHSEHKDIAAHEKKHIITKEAKEAKEAKETAAHHDEGSVEEANIFGEILAIIASIFLLIGHLMNLAEIKRVKGNCLAEVCT